MNANLRIGRSGRQESAAAVWICAFVSGCFAFDNSALFREGNASYLEHAVAALLALAVFEGMMRAIRARNGRDLFVLLGDAKWKKALAVLLIAALLLAAMQPLQHFLLTVTQYVFVDARQVSICLWLLPCLALLSMLGAETLLRTSRILLPVLLLSVIGTLLSGISQYRIYRLFPVPLGTPEKLLRDLPPAFFRAFSPLLMLLCIGEGTQRVDAMQNAGRIGALAGAGTVIAMLLGLSFGFSYATLEKIPSPFYRLLVEVRAENPTLRLDRAVLFLWMAGALLSSALYLYAAGVCFCKAFRARDVRPVACGLCALITALILILYYDTEQTANALKLLYRYAWTTALLPLPLLAMRGKERTLCGA